MNFVQVTDNQLISIWFACLAWLNSTLTTEEKNTILEKALMAKILDSNQPLAIVQSGLSEFDGALLDYAKAVEQRVRGLNASNISTGSAVVDAAFKEQIDKLIALNFGSVVVEVV